MSADISRPGTIGGDCADADRTAGSRRALVRLVAAFGVGWAVVFLIAGLGHSLQLYADGSLFSYAIAMGEAWDYHWHNISGRAAVYLYAHLPAEAYLALTGHAEGAVTLYGALFFAAPLIGLAATYRLDRSDGRVVFAWACLATGLLGPLVFGFPTEMWVTMALFWPTLALALDPSTRSRTWAFTAAAGTALGLTHGGGLVLALAIAVIAGIAAGWRSAQVKRAAAAAACAIAVSLLVRLAIPPDAYFATVMTRAAFNFVDLSNLAAPAVLLLAGALAGFTVLTLVLGMLGSRQSWLIGFLVIAGLLAVYWTLLDTSLHAEARYSSRTVLLGALPILGLIAAAGTRGKQATVDPAARLAGHAAALFWSRGGVALAGGALGLVTLVHGVETAKFAAAWSDYKAAVRAIAMGGASDPGLGDPRFVSSQRLKQAAPMLDGLSWYSTTHYLSVLLAPGHLPARLVVNPKPGYFWLDCRMATRSAEDDRAIPRASRLLIARHACLNRP